MADEMWTEKDWEPEWMRRVDMEADQARANAIAAEAKKDALSQRQSGDWCLRLVIHELDMRIINAAPGTRYQVVFVEIGDDEKPVDHINAERNKWAELGAVQQAGMRCKEERFQKWLRDELHFEVHGEESAAGAVRFHCGIDSRSELGKPGQALARQKWHAMDNAYQAWILTP